LLTRAVASRILAGGCRESIPYVDCCGEKWVRFCAGIRTALPFTTPLDKSTPTWFGRGGLKPRYPMCQITARLNLRGGTAAQERVLESMRERLTILVACDAS
jgi:hypothetical protein